MNNVVNKSNRDIGITVDLPEPFLGRILVEAQEDDVTAHMMKKAGIDIGSSVIQLPESFTDKYSVPVTRGKIIKMAGDAYGQFFSEKTGWYGNCPKVGDTIIFTTQRATAVDLDRKYYLVLDEHTLGVYPNNKDKEEV